jgi:hypothetical protein
MQGLHFLIPRDVVANCNVCKTSQHLKKELFKQITVSFSLEHIMIDLIDLKSSKSTNRGFSWVLNIVDVYSEYAKAGMSNPRPVGRMRPPVSNFVARRANNFNLSFLFHQHSKGHRNYNHIIT